MEDKWISVEDKFPDTNQKWSESDYVLVLNANNGDLGVAWYNSKSNEWRLSHSITSSLCIKVTHWSPIPELPKQ